jgi:hypothetical protein
MMEYHVEQTRPIHTTTVALQAAREALESLSAQPAPVQEPWKYRRWNDEAEKWELTDDCGWPSEPLYTTPPAQRLWVGLTDEQFQAIRSRLSRQDGWDGDGWDLALKEAIEAKLKEKNT